MANGVVYSHFEGGLECGKGSNFEIGLRTPLSKFIFYSTVDYICSQATQILLFLLFIFFCFQVCKEEEEEEEACEFSEF